VIALFPVTVGIIAVKFAYTWLLFRAFLPSASFEEFAGVSLILFLALFFAPTPGASGIAEGSATAFLATSLAPAASMAFVLYWRLLTLYGPVVGGGFVLLHQMSRDSGRLGGPRGPG
jgi:uncharacterized protein (TIRG00374 family)